jgi:hypothetical protein
MVGVKMPEYELVNYATGELETFETSIDLSILKAYNEWVVEKKLNPPSLSPEEFAREMEDVRQRNTVAEVIEYLETYTKGMSVPSDIVAHAIDLLRGVK